MERRMGLRDLVGAVWDTIAYHPFTDHLRATRLRLWFWRRLRPARWRSLSRINLGCGPHRLEGFCNVDIRGAADLRFNLLRRFPLPDAVADFVYSEHALEHFLQEDAQHILSECFRILKPNGVLRLSVPDAWMLADPTDALAVAHLNRRYFAHDHRSVYTPALLLHMLRRAGFREAAHVSETVAGWSPPELLARAHKRPTGNLVVEARRD